MSELVECDSIQSQVIKTRCRFPLFPSGGSVKVDRIPLDPAVVMLELASVICRVGIIQIHFPFLAIVWHGLCRLTRTYEFQCQITQAGRVALAVFCEANNNLSNFNA